MKYIVSLSFLVYAPNVNAFLTTTPHEIHPSLHRHTLSPTPNSSCRFYQIDGPQDLLFLEKPKTKFDITWNRHYSELQQYLSQHGNTEVPHHHKTLGRWVANQRQAYKLFHNPNKQSSMTQERIAALDAVGFQWEIQCPWQSRFQELMEYQQQHGDCLVPYSYPPNPKLGRWVNRQRLEYSYVRQGKKSSMTEERMAILKSIDFEFQKEKRPTYTILPADSIPSSSSTEHDSSYQKRPMKILHQFVDACGEQHMIVTHRTTPTSQSSHDGSTSDEQRIPSRTPQPPIPPPPPSTKSIQTQRWNDRYQELCEYQQCHGDCLVPQKYPPNPPLGLWVKSQRRQAKLRLTNGSSKISNSSSSSSMTRERFQKLNKIGFVWDVRTLSSGVSSSSFTSMSEEGMEFEKKDDILKNDTDRQLFAYWRNRFQGLHP